MGLMDEQKRAITFGTFKAGSAEGIMCSSCGSDIVPVELKHAEVLRLEEGDVILVRIAERQSQAMRELVSRRFKELFPHNRALLIEGDVSISVIRRELQAV